MESGYSQVVLESDSKVAIDLLSSADQCLNEFGVILHDILEWFKKVEVRFNFVFIIALHVVYFC